MEKCKLDFIDLQVYFKAPKGYLFDLEQVCRLGERLFKKETVFPYTAYASFLGRGDRINLGALTIPASAIVSVKQHLTALAESVRLVRDEDIIDN